MRLLVSLFDFVLTGAIFALAAFAVAIGVQTLGSSDQSSIFSALESDGSDEIAASNAAPPAVVRVKPVKVTDQFEISRRFLGQIEASQTAKLSFENGGYVTEIIFDEGDSVLEGQVLARQDTSLLELQRDQVQASRKALQAELEFAEAQVERIETLTQRGVAGAEQKDQTISTRNALVARLAATAAEINALSIQIEKASLIAPFDGFVAERSVDTGETVGAVQRVLTLTQRGAARFRVGLPPHIEIEAFSETAVEIDNRTYDAFLTGIRPDLDAQTRTRTLIFILPDLEAYGIGRAGSLQAKDVIEGRGTWVNAEALREGTGNVWSVLIVDNDNKVQQVVVEILHVETNRAYVSGGFEAGDRLIVSGAHKVAPGQTVNVE